MVTVNLVRRTVIGNLRLVVAKVSFDSSYPTGGESLTTTDLGLEAIEFLSAEPKSGYIFEYDHTNQKLKAYYADYDAAADGALIEVADTTDLSGVTNVYIWAVGR